MQAAIVTRYGPPNVLQIREVPKPQAKAGQVIIRQHATSLNSGDARIRGANMPPGFGLILRLVFGLRGPRQPILGICVAGEVSEIGPGVTGITLGDRVLATTGFAMRAHAEYVAVKANRLVPLPESLGMEEAAALPFGALTALYYLRDRAKVQPGESVLVIGASGAVGAATVQLAHHFGARVTAVCNTKNVELVRSLGADRVVDYTREDFTKSGERYDVVLDAVQKHSFRRSRRSLLPGGLYVATDLGFLWHVPLLALLTRWIGSRKLVFALDGPTKEDLALVEELIEAGRYRAVVDRTYPLEHVVAATRYVETGQKTGNVVLTVNREDTPAPGMA